MSRKGSGIRILHDKKNRSRENAVMSAVFAFFCVTVLSCAWWNGFLSVFLPGVSAFWLYTCLAGAVMVLVFLDRRMGGWSVFLSFLAAGIFLWYDRADVLEIVLNGNITDLRLAGFLAAAASVPVLEVWVIVFRTGKGRFFAGILMSAPFITAACFRYFQGPGDGWFLFLSGAVYFACSATENFRSGIPAALFLLAAVTGISIYGGRMLDAGRETEGGFYQTARNTLQTELIGNVERLIYGEPEEERQDTAGPVEVSGDDSEDMNGMEESAESSGEDQPEGSGADRPLLEGTSGGSGNFTPEDDSGMEHLKSVSSFVPADGVLGSVIVQNRPDSTWYEVLLIGIRYTGDGWEEGPVSYLGRRQKLSGEELAPYLEYPEGLDGLRGLCAGWNVSSFETVKSQIDQVLALAVYDTDPGPTPQEQDFAEYFLFENQKGFCVHFATTAALLYRMCGYPSRYVEGYAIPPDAFSEREDGRYEARIDGSMGHAWCQVYDEDEETWTDVEHTPSVPLASAENAQGDSISGGNDLAENPMEEKGDGEGKKPEEPMGILPEVCLFAVLAVVILFPVQARIRRKRLEKKVRRKKGGSGVKAMYDALLRTADLLELEAIPGECGDWFETTVMRLLFDRPETERDAEEELWETGDRLYREFAHRVWKHMTGWQRFQYRYIRCLKPLRDREKEGMGRKKKQAEKTEKRG